MRIEVLSTFKCYIYSVLINDRYSMKKHKNMIKMHACNFDEMLIGPQRVLKVVRFNKHNMCYAEEGQKAYRLNDVAELIRNNQNSIKMNRLCL